MNLRYAICLSFFLPTAISLHSESKPRVWDNGFFSIRLENDGMDIYHGVSKLAEDLSFEFNFVRPDSVFIRNILHDTLTLELRFSDTDGFHDDFPGSLTLTVAQSEGSLHFYAAHPAFEHVTIRKKDLNEHYFGLVEKLYPDNARNPDLRGQVVDVDVYGEGSRDYAENYASAYSAFFMSSAGYGGFFDTFAKGRYQFAVNGITRIDHQTASLDGYLFYGPTGERKGDEAVFIHAFPGGTGDSTSFDYVDRFDDGCEKKMRLTRMADRIIFDSEALSTRSTVEVRCKTKRGKVLLNGREVKMQFDRIRGSSTIGLPKGRPIRLELF